MSTNEERQRQARTLRHVRRLLNMDDADIPISFPDSLADAVLRYDFGTPSLRVSLHTSPPQEITNERITNMEDRGIEPPDFDGSTYESAASDNTSGGWSTTPPDEWRQAPRQTEPANPPEDDSEADDLPGYGNGDQIHRVTFDTPLGVTNTSYTAIEDKLVRIEEKIEEMKRIVSNIEQVIDNFTNSLAVTLNRMEAEDELLRKDAEKNNELYNADF